MADELTPVEQKFIADIAAYIDDVKRAGDDAQKFADANREASTATAGLRDHSMETAAALGHVRDEALAAAAAEKKLDDNAKKAGDSAGSLKSRLSDVGGAAAAITGVGDAFSIFSKDASMASKVMSGFSLATGLLEAPMAGLIVGVGGLASALAAGGIGMVAFGAVAKANYSAASTAANQVQTAQIAYNAAVATGAKQSTAYAAEQKAILKAYAQLSPAQIQLSKEIGNAKNAWQSFVQANTSGTAQIMSQGIGLLPKIFQMMQPFIASTEAGLGDLMVKLKGGLNSGWMASFVQTMSTFSGPAISGIGTAIGNVVKGIAGIIQAFVPMGVTVLGGLDKITAKFATWGQTLTQHSGFQSLMQMAQADMPYVITIVKNLGQAIVKLGGSMTGLSTFSNSKAILQLAAPLSQLLNALVSVNPALTRFALYAIAAGGAANKMKPAFQALAGGVTAIKGGASAASNFAKGLSDAGQAASADTGAWGTIGGKISTISSALASAGAAAGRFAVTMATTGAKATVSFAVSAAKAVASAAVTVASFLAEAAAAMVAFVAENLATLGIVAAIALLIAGIVLLATHWKQVWGDIKNWALDAWHFLDNNVIHPIMHGISDLVNWVKSHWQLLATILATVLLGPVGFIVAFIATHWQQIIHATSALVSSVFSFFRSLPGKILSALGDVGSLLWNAGKAIVQGLINGIQSMFGVLGNVASSIGHFIASLKGPLPKDLVLLVPHGQAIMQGLMDGITSKKGELAGLLGGLTGGIPGMVGGAGGGGNVGAPSVHVTVPLTLGAGTAGYSDPRFLQYIQGVVQEAVLRYTGINPSNGLNLAGKF